MDPRFQFRIDARLALQPTESFGRVRPGSQAPERSNPGLPPHRGPAHLVDELEAGARRALAANGFADAAVERTDAYSNLASGELHRAARTERARLMGTSTAALLRAVFRPTLRLRVAMSHALDRWRQRRLELATYRMLRELDPRTLRDIGFDASEVLSVALEVAGTVDAHRVRSTHVRNGLYP